MIEIKLSKSLFLRARSLLTLSVFAREISMTFLGVTTFSVHILRIGLNLYRFLRDAFHESRSHCVLKFLPATY